MRMLRNQRGVALVTALLLTMLCLVIAITLLYSITLGTRVSASQKRYKTARAAATGGVELLTRELIPRLFQGDPGNLQPSMDQIQSDYSLVHLELHTQPSCLAQKLTTASKNWSLCSANQQTDDPALNPDLTFQLGALPATTPGFTISGKIVDTVPGNSDKGGIDYLDQGSSVTGNDDGIHPQHVPGLFTISVQGTRENNPADKARLSVLYAY